MSTRPRPPLPKWKLPLPVKTGLWGRTPPALFPSVLGLAGLSLAWRRGINQFALPSGLADLLAGAVVLFGAFALLALIVKIAQRPAVLEEDLRILPGRAGIATAVLLAYLLAVLVAPIWPALGRVIWWLVFAAQLYAIYSITAALLSGPAEQRRVNPVWHLSYAGLIVGAMAAQQMGLHPMARILFWPALLAALAIWAVSAWQFLRETPPAPLRPLLAIHLAPVALLGSVMAGFGWGAAATALAFVAAALLIALLLSVRWLLAAGFTPFWGALTFPLASTASLFLALEWRYAGGITLVLATVVILPIMFRVAKMWASGQLAIKTNAAAA